MNILINGQAADITLENEKTVGEILSGLEQWLSGSGNRLSGLVIDGAVIGAEALDECFGHDIARIKNIDIIVSSWIDLAAQALISLGQVCTLYREAAFDKRGETVSQWKASPAAAFIEVEIPDVFIMASKSFSGEGISPADLGLLTEERLHELEDPVAVIRSMKELVSGICVRMEELPLDIQLGRDARAAETMQIFSGAGEKFFRLIGILKQAGFPTDDLTVGGLSVKSFNDEFGAVLKDLCLAYEGNDTVLVGDLCEYELSPRLLKLYSALTERFAGIKEAV